MTIMKRTPRISDTEWEIMRVVWARHPITAAEIIARLAEADSTWHPKTARTLLARLVRKQALDYEPRGRLYVYGPRVSEQECVAAASETFLERVFGGSLEPMLAHLKRRDRPLNWLVSVLQMLYWFNPLVWLGSARSWQGAIGFVPPRFLQIQLRHLDGRLVLASHGECNFARVGLALGGRFDSGLEGLVVQCL